MMDQVLKGLSFAWCYIDDVWSYLTIHHRDMLNTYNMCFNAFKFGDYAYTMENVSFPMIGLPNLRHMIT